MARIKELCLYRNLIQDSVISGMVQVEQENEEHKEQMVEVFYEQIGKMSEVIEQYGLEGNLWKVYLTLQLIYSENAYSLGCEGSTRAKGSLYQLAIHDGEILMELYRLDLKKMEEHLGLDCVFVILEYQSKENRKHLFNKEMQQRIMNLSMQLNQAQSPKEFLEILSTFYQKVGVGEFGLHKAFRLEQRGEDHVVTPIRNIPNTRLDDLIGYEIPKKKLIDNTVAFLEGRPANNCLLFGDAGTGKSSSIKGILNQYFDQGLRIIEVYKHQFQYLNQIISQIKNRNYKFIIYMDDLSFEEFEIEYKYLKAVIEGGLEKKPDNVLIYATSNRRHLIRESFSDKEGRRDDLHASDTVQEKLSLAARFGVTIFFISPDKEKFQEMVKFLAKKNGLEMQENELLEEANKWEVSHGGRSGRTAQQFIDYLFSQKK